MASLKSLTFLAAAAVLTSGAPAEARRAPHGPERGIDSLNQPVVEREDYVLDVAAPGGELSSSERSRLRAWFRSLGLGYGDQIFVDEAYGAGAASADVERILGERGLLLSEGAPVIPGGLPPGTVRVIVSRSIAWVPNCPGADNYRGGSSTSANYGCSVNSNWAAMVANPQDLVLGQAGAVGTDQGVSNKAIRVYRDTAPTGTKGLAETVTRGGK